MTLPIVSFPRLWHVGSLDPNDKRDGSFEGAGLSISRHPGAWRTIGRGVVTGPCWVSDCADKVLLDVHALSAEQTAAVFAWGAASGHCEPRTQWRVAIWDDELEDEMVSHYRTREEAVEEAGCQVDDVDDVITEIPGHVGTDLLRAAVRATHDIVGDALVLDHLLPLWAETVEDLDGVWWEDRLDTLALSAPRGCIPAAQVGEWGFTPAPCEPDEDSDFEDDEIDS